MKKRKQKIQVVKGGDPTGMVRPRKQRVSKHAEFIEACHQLEVGDYFELPVPRGRSILREVTRFQRVIQRYVTPDIDPSTKVVVRMTVRRSVLILCKQRGTR